MARRELGEASRGSKARSAYPPAFRFDDEDLPALGLRAINKWLTGLAAALGLAASGSASMLKKETYAIMSLGLEQSLDSLRMRLKYGEHEDCVLGTAVGTRRGVVRKAARRPIFTIRLGG